MTEAPLSVLLAEDNVVSQRVASALLTAIGHRVTVCNNGQEAVQALQQGMFDIIVMDLRMPVLDGMAAAAEIRALPDRGKAAIPILAISAHVRDDDIERCRASGIDHVLSKPLRAEKLAALMRRCVTTRQATPTPPAAAFDELLDMSHIKALQDALSPQKLAELYDLARDLLQVSSAALRMGWQQSDQTQIAMAAHRLAGVARNFGCLALGRCAARIEDAALKGGNSDAEQTQFESLLTASLAAMPA